jgi:broad specificity phosphatase PhoE
MPNCNSGRPGPIRALAPRVSVLPAGPRAEPARPRHGYGRHMPRSPSWLARGDELILVRHGSTDWSVSLRHTGRSDVPLNEAGRRQAVLVGRRVSGLKFAFVATSPMSRAADTCRLAGIEGRAEILADLREWDYGDYEGMTTAEITSVRPGWDLWRDGCPHGESAKEVGERADRVIEAFRLAGGAGIVFAHGHLLRVLAARWLGLPPSGGRLLVLDAGGTCVLSRERDTPVLALWNLPPGGLPAG